MKQYTNAYRRIPVYAYQFMAGPAALGPRGRVHSRAGTGTRQAGRRGRIAVWRGAFEGDVVQR